MNSRFAIAGLMLVVGIFTGCVRGVHGGNPALPLSNSNGTAGIFPASESAVLVAITNAFATESASNPFWNRGMMLFPAAEDSYLVPNWHPTNGYVLFPLEGPITSVPLEGGAQVSVPYTAYFYITTAPVDSSHTSVSVRTILATVNDGKEVGVHGGWANHVRDVPPVKEEEDNVLMAISNAVIAQPIPVIERGVKGGSFEHP